MKRILINATQNEEIRVALCKGNHLYDFDLENRTREQKKSNIYKGHVTRVEPSLEAVFVEYGSQRQGFLPIREISTEYLSGNPRDENIKKLIKEGDELIVQVEKEERGNKGAALSTYVSLAGRYLVLMPNNPRGGGISRQISGKLREDMKRMLGNLDLPKGMSVIIRTAGIGKTQEDLQHDLNHLLNIWQAIQEQNQKYPSPRLVHQEAGVVTRAVRDYLRDDIAEIWIDNENAYIEASGFIDAVMPKQAEKLRKYTDYEPMFSRFNIEKQIETAYQREVRLPSGGSIVIDQTEALVSIDINSAKSTKGSDVAETAYHTNLEAADEIARQLRLRDMGGLVVIDFIDMNDNKHQKEVEKRLIDATKYDRARVQFGEISKFGLMEMSRQRLRPSLEESTGYICPRCHGNGMIRDLRSLSLSIMRQIEQIALKERQGEVQAEVPTDIAAFLLNEKRDSLVYLEQDSGTRITILPHAHLESPNFKLHFNRDGFAPSSYERITDTQQQEHSDLGYNVDWQTAEKERPEQQPTRQPRQTANSSNQQKNRSSEQQNTAAQSSNKPANHNNDRRNHKNANDAKPASNTQAESKPSVVETAAPSQPSDTTSQPKAVAWLSNLFAQAPQAQTTASVSSRDAAEAIEALVNTGAQSLGSFGQVDNHALNNAVASDEQTSQQNDRQKNDNQRSESNTTRQNNRRNNDSDTDDSNNEDRRRRKTRKSRSSKPRPRKETTDEAGNNANDTRTQSNDTDDKSSENRDKRQQDNKRTNDRNRNTRQDSRQTSERQADSNDDNTKIDEQTRTKRKSHSQRGSRGKLERGETLTADNVKQGKQQNTTTDARNDKGSSGTRRSQDPNEVVLQVNEAPTALKKPEVVHLSLDDSKSAKTKPQATDKQNSASKATSVEAAKEQVTSHPVTSQAATKQNADEGQAQKQGDNEKNTKKPTTESTSKVKESSKDETPNKTAQSEVATDSSSQKVTTDENSQPVETQTTSTKGEQTEAIKSVATEAQDVKASAAKQNADDTDSLSQSDKAQNAQSTSNSESGSQVSSSGLKFTREALFGERYVTAKKFGQASNDPRVVREQQTRSAQANTQAPVAATAIRGTVGEFIRATLPDAQTRMAEDGIINSFIATVALYSEQASDDAASTGSSSHSTQSFDFSNYGYQPLAADYLARFETMTKAVRQFAAAQGKTEVQPRSIGKRASNDPRGQHADYQEAAVLSVPAQSTSDTDVEDKPSLSRADEAGVKVDAHDVDATALANQAKADDVSADSEQLLEIEQAQAATSSAQDVQADAQNRDVESSSEAVASVTTSEAQVSKEDSQAAKSKTTIASYKNMIENVAEQLLPQTGMFNLTTPKVPKARSRKPKTEHKKPTQAEKLAADESENDS